MSKAIDDLLRGRSVIDDYLGNPDKSRIPAVTASLAEIGFTSIEDFYDQDKKLSLEELVSCYKVVHRVTGEDNPICDGCINEEVPDCIRLTSNKKTFADLDCFELRANTPERLSILGNNDKLLKAQKAAHDAKEAKDKKQTVPYGWSDLIKYWNFIYGDAKSGCVIRIAEVKKPKFDPWWKLKERVLPYASSKDRVK